MSELVLKPTATAQWHSLINDAQSQCNLHLGEDQESYLVFLLMRFIERPELASKIMAMEFLQSMHKSGKERSDSLRDVGDQCLLFSGLFPKRAERRRVKVSYFVNIGKAAYTQLSETRMEGLAKLYQTLALQFVAMMDVLQAVRVMGTNSPILEPLAALELWQDTGSQQALGALRAVTNGTPGGINDTQKH